jgi:hypothetical protein
MGPTRASGDHLGLPALDTEAREQKGEERDATLDLILKYLKTNKTFKTCYKTPAKIPEKHLKPL